jgi:hypothetical protein
MYCDISMHHLQRRLSTSPSADQRGEAQLFTIFWFCNYAIFNILYWEGTPCNYVIFYIFISFSVWELSYCLFKLHDYFLLPTSLLWSLDLGRLQICCYLEWDGDSDCFFFDLLTQIVALLREGIFLSDEIRWIGPRLLAMCLWARPELIVVTDGRCVASSVV